MRLTKRQLTFIGKTAALLPDLKIQTKLGNKPLNHYRKMKRACETYGFEKGGSAYLIKIGKLVGEAKKEMK